MHPRERLRLKSIISTTCSFITFSTIVYKMCGFEGNEGEKVWGGLRPDKQTSGWSGKFP